MFISSFFIVIHCHQGFKWLDVIKVLGWFYYINFNKNYINGVMLNPLDLYCNLKTFKMKKLFLVMILLGTAPMFAQQKEINITPNNSWFKAGITAGVPVGDASDFSSVNIGVDLRAQYLVNPNFAIGGATGYNHFFGKDGVDDFGVIPLAGFARYYFAREGLFVGADAGFGFVTNIESNVGGLYINPHIGYHNRDWNFYVFYQNTFAENNVDLQTVGVGATYNIRFK